jgi:hypothetical protein
MIQHTFTQERPMPNNLSSIEEQTSELVEATVKLLWAHRDDVANGKVASDSARVYLALVKGACEALPARLGAFKRRVRGDQRCDHGCC